MFYPEHYTKNCQLILSTCNSNASHLTLYRKHTQHFEASAEENLMVKIDNAIQIYM